MSIGKTSGTVNVTEWKTLYFCCPSDVVLKVSIEQRNCSHLIERKSVTRPSLTAFFLIFKVLLIAQAICHNICLFRPFTHAVNSLSGAWSWVYQSSNSNQIYGLFQLSQKNLSRNPTSFFSLIHLLTSKFNSAFQRTRWKQEENLIKGKRWVQLTIPTLIIILLFLNN